MRNAKNSARAAMKQATRGGRRFESREERGPRDPALWEAMERFQKGEMSADDFRTFVEAYTHNNK